MTDKTNICDDCGRPTPEGACNYCHPVIDVGELAERLFPDNPNIVVFIDQREVTDKSEERRTRKAIGSLTDPGRSRGSR